MFTNRLPDSKRRVMAPVAFTAIMLTVASLVDAHHSVAVFDFKKTVELSGTVKEFRWTNPHMFVELLVTEGDATTQWSVESGTPNVNSRHGWKRDDLKPGDRVSLSLHPFRDGSKGGSLIAVTLQDGRVLTGPGAGGSDLLPKQQ